MTKIRCGFAAKLDLPAKIVSDSLLHSWLWKLVICSFVMILFSLAPFISCFVLLHRFSIAIVYALCTTMR